MLGTFLASSRTVFACALFFSLGSGRWRSQITRKMLQNKLSFSMALGVGNKASNSKASYFNTGYHPCLRGKDCFFFFWSIDFVEIKLSIWNWRKLYKITAMCSLLFDFLCFRLKLFQENRIVRSKSKSIKQKPMFLKRGSRPQTSRFRLPISERGHHKRWLALGSKIVGEFLYLITRNRGFSSPQPHTYARHRPYHSKLL